MALLLHAGIFMGTTLLALLLTHRFFFAAESSEQDQYYLRGGVTKMVVLSGRPKHVGGKYSLYRFKLYDPKSELGADMQRISINFDFVSNQDVEYDPKKSGRYPVEDFEQKGYFEIIEKEGSDIDTILRRNVDAEKPFEISIKGPHGNIKYTGNGKFLE